jgi:two-component system, OmpR family, KDP operon response regulator KdpE
MKILLVEDEQVIRDALAAKLINEGFRVVTAADGATAVRAFHENEFDLAILDIILPGQLDGLALCRRIREFSDLPVMMLSAQAISEHDIVEGLQAGADEYLVKPVRSNEFIARVRALLRRAALNTPTTEMHYDDGYLSVDQHRRHVRVQGNKVHLTPTEFKLLSVLIDHAGRVVPQRELLEQVWGQEYVDDIYYPRVYVSQLRHKIEPDPTAPTYILTEHRVGYRFEKQPMTTKP